MAKLKQKISKGATLFFDGDWMSDGRFAAREEFVQVSSRERQTLIDSGVPFSANWHKNPDKVEIVTGDQALEILPNISSVIPAHGAESVALERRPFNYVPRAWDSEADGFAIFGPPDDKTPEALRLVALRYANLLTLGDVFEDPETEALYILDPRNAGAGPVVIVMPAKLDLLPDRIRATFGV